MSYHFDPLLAKLIVWAPSRTAAVERMKRALHDFVLLGIRNNIEFLRRVISTDDFIAGKLDTSFLDRHQELFSVPSDIPPEAILIASHPLPPVEGSRAAADEGPQSTQRDVWTSSGPWRHSTQAPRHPLPFRLLDPTHIEFSGKRRRFYVMRDQDFCVVWLDGHTYSVDRAEKTRPAQLASLSASGEIRALMPGKILRIEVGIGDTVSEKQTVATMESMKMESSLESPRAGQVTHIFFAPGQTVEMGELIMMIS